MANLKILRQKKFMTQTELAEKVGVTQATISQWETGYTEPNMTAIVKLCELLSCTADELLGIKAGA